MRRRIVEPGQASLFAEPAEPVRPKPPPRAPAHHCHVPGCDVAVPPKLLMCRKHWAMVPSSIRRDVWRFFDPAQCETGAANRPRPTDSWMRAAKAAIEAVLDALADRLVKATPATVLALEDEPPAGMTTATFRIVMRRAVTAGRLRFDGDKLTT